MQNGDSHEADPARERIGEILRSALAPADDAPLEDETRRLMLHLSCEPIEAPTRPAPQPPRGKSLIRRVLGKKTRARA